MHNLCIPGPVVVLVRRLVHVISTISIAQQCPKGRRLDHGFSFLDREEPEEATPASSTVQDEGYTSLIKTLTMRWAQLSKAAAWNVLLLQTASLERDQLNGATGTWLPSLSSPWNLSTTAPEESPESSEQDEQYNSHDENDNPRLPCGKNSKDGQHMNQDFDNDIIHRLMNNPTLYDPIRTPRFPIVLCHGLYGFDVRGPSSFPSLQMHYWSNILNILRKKVGAEVIFTSVPSTGSIVSRSTKLHEFLQNEAQGRGINFIGHSMGGLDCRHLISHIQPVDYTPLSLTTVGTPHRGSPFMDWCQDNIGLGKMDAKDPPGHQPFNDTSRHSRVFHPRPSSDSHASSSKTSKPSLSFASLPSSFTTLLLYALDSPAFANLSTRYLNEVFNPATPDVPGVKYFSVAGRIDSVSIWHPLWLPKLVLDGVEQRDKTAVDSADFGNDCLVSIQSAKWGEFLGVLEGCDHWDMRGARGLDLGMDLSSLAVPSFARSSTKKVEQGNDSWGIKDWGRYVKVWRSAEDRVTASSSLGSSETAVYNDESGDRDREKALRLSTDKVSAVLDWIVEQVPSVARNSDSAEDRIRSKRRDVATKEGLERMYVALSRKLYDEGL